MVIFKHLFLFEGLFPLAFTLFCLIMALLYKRHHNWALYLKCSLSKKLNRLSIISLIQWLNCFLLYHYILSIFSSTSMHCLENQISLVITTSKAFSDAALSRTFICRMFSVSGLQQLMCTTQHLVRLNGISCLTDQY